MTIPRDIRPCFHLESAAEGTLIVDIDLAQLARPRAVRARLRQGMAELSIELHRRPDVEKVFAVVWTGAQPAGPREMNLAAAAAEGVHRRAEMLRGTPLGLAVVFADDHAVADRVLQRLRSSTRSVPDGVSAMTWPDVCAYGVHACAAAYRL